MSKIFLSYSRRDESAIKKIRERLTSSGVEVWLDQTDIEPGDRIPDKIGRGIRECDYFLIALSPISVESEWVQMELNIALAEEIKRKVKFVIPMLMEKCIIPSIIQDRAYVNLSNPELFEDKLSVLLGTVRAERLSGRPASRNLDRVFLLAGPTSAGKDTLMTAVLKRLRQQNVDIKVIKKYTNRDPRSGEKEAEANYYKFMSEKEIAKLYYNGDIIYKYNKYGHLYGIENITRAVSSGGTYVCIATVLDGIKELVARLNQSRLLVIPILILAPEEDLQERLDSRHLADKEDRLKELENDLIYLANNKESIDRTFQIQLSNSNDDAFHKSRDSLVNQILEYINMPVS